MKNVFKYIVLSLLFFNTVIYCSEDFSEITKEAISYCLDICDILPTSLQFVKSNDHGIACNTIDRKIYINESLCRGDKDLLIFSILHEIGHIRNLSNQKSVIFQKLYKVVLENILNQLIFNDSIDVDMMLSFSTKLKQKSKDLMQEVDESEELLANRHACMQLIKKNNFIPILKFLCYITLYSFGDADRLDATHPLITKEYEEIKKILEFFGYTLIKKIDLTKNPTLLSINIKICQADRVYQEAKAEVSSAGITFS